MNYQDLERINKTLPQIDFKGKGYIEVNKRVMAFRQLYPEGAIITEMTQYSPESCVIVAKAYSDTGVLLATGIAEEKSDTSYINKTSYIENCETSAVGRCLGFLGIGIDTSIASYEEVDNAVKKQEMLKTKEEVNKSQKEGLIKACEELGLKIDEVLSQVGWSKGDTFTKEMYGKAMNLLIAKRGEANT